MSSVGLGIFSGEEPFGRSVMDLCLCIEKASAIMRWKKHLKYLRMKEIIVIDQKNAELLCSFMFIVVGQSSF